MQTAEMTKLHAAATELGSQSPKATTLVGLSPGMWVKSGGLVSPSPQQKQPSISLQSAYHQPAVSLISTHGLSTQVSPKAVQNSGQGQGDVSPHQGNKQGQVRPPVPLGLPSKPPPPTICHTLHRDCPCFWRLRVGTVLLCMVCRLG